MSHKSRNDNGHVIKPCLLSVLDDQVSIVDRDFDCRIKGDTLHTQLLQTFET